VAPQRFPPSSCADMSPRARGAPPPPPPYQRRHDRRAATARSAPPAAPPGPPRPMSSPHPTKRYVTTLRGSHRRSPSSPSVVRSQTQRCPPVHVHVLPDGRVRLDDEIRIGSLLLAARSRKLYSRSSIERLRLTHRVEAASLRPVVCETVIACAAARATRGRSRGDDREIVPEDGVADPSPESADPAPAATARSITLRSSRTCPATG